jgi:predicted lipoprotein with Yx(FWY)xxD motif
MTIITAIKSRTLVAGAVAASAAIALAGCAAPSGGTTAAGAGAGSGSGSGSGGATTVSVRDVSGMSGALTTADGRTLYFSDQENGAVRCISSACTDVWIPLTVPAGSQPSGPGQLAGRLGTVHRPDGAAQVALDDRPLYTFSFDKGAGQASGDDQRDSFDGTAFTWHLATAAGGTGSASTTTTAPASTAGGGYGYGY